MKKIPCGDQVCTGVCGAPLGATCSGREETLVERAHRLAEETEAAWPHIDEETRRVLARDLEEARDHAARPWLYE